jgi:UDP-glucose-4-epimerase GalE
MRVLVAGGAGYVGSHAVRALVAAGHEVTVYDNLVAGHRRAVDPQAAFIHGDVGDRAMVDRLLAASRFDAVMHFAAWLNVGESVARPLMYYENNVANTLRLLQSMEQHGVKRFIFSSTCAVYGEPESVPIVEELRKNPINPYGRTKLAVEWMLQDAAAAWGLGSVALRYFNASGASADGVIGEDHDPELHLIPLVLQVALGQRPEIKIFGTDYPTPDGTCVRDYIHVEDLATAHLAALGQCEPGRAEAFNVGTGRGASVREIIETARAVTGQAIPTVEVARRPGDPPTLYANPAKIKSRLGWSPRYTEIRPIIETAWRWHRSHPDGFAD